MPIRRIWEARESAGKHVLSDWDVPKEQQAKLDIRLRLLRTAEVDTAGRVALPPAMLEGPGVWGEPFIYKIRLHGKQALRPMLCLGPVNAEKEWTVLARAREQGNNLTNQRQAAKTATTRRIEILNGTRGRRLYRE